MKAENITVRQAEPGELGAVAELRWRWIVENGTTPETLDRAGWNSPRLLHARVNGSTS
ncbi:hypothetical protein SALBM311S_03024 [Streptomyces alboniger]